MDFHKIKKEEEQISLSYSNYDQKEFKEISDQLNRPLEKEVVSQRAAFGGAKVSYLEGWRSIQIANDIFGFNGWSSEIKNFTVDFLDCVEGKWSVGVSVHVRVLVKDGSFHEDVGYGIMENSKSKGQAFEKAKKEAVTDGIKRALRFFGSALGNCLYDKKFLVNLNKVQRPTTNIASAPPLNNQSYTNNSSLQNEFNSNANNPTNFNNSKMGSRPNFNHSNTAATNLSNNNNPNNSYTGAPNQKVMLSNLKNNYNQNKQPFTTTPATINNQQQMQTNTNNFQSNMPLTNNINPQENNTNADRNQFIPTSANNTNLPQLNKSSNNYQSNVRLPIASGNPQYNQVKINKTIQNHNNNVKPPNMIINNAVSIQSELQLSIDKTKNLLNPDFEFLTQDESFCAEDEAELFRTMDELEKKATTKKESQSTILLNPSRSSIMEQFKFDTSGNLKVSNVAFPIQTTMNNSNKNRNDNPTKRFRDS